MTRMPRMLQASNMQDGQVFVAISHCLSSCCSCTQVSMKVFGLSTMDSASMLKAMAFFLCGCKLADTCIWQTSHARLLKHSANGQITTPITPRCQSKVTCQMQSDLAINIRNEKQTDLFFFFFTSFVSYIKAYIKILKDLPLNPALSS